MHVDVLKSYEREPHTHTPHMHTPPMKTKLTRRQRWGEPFQNQSSASKRQTAAEEEAETGSAGGTGTI